MEGQGHWISHRTGTLTPLRPGGGGGVEGVEGKWEEVECFFNKKGGKNKLICSNIR